MLYKCIVNLCFYQIPDLVGDDVIAGFDRQSLKPSKFSNFRRNTRIYISLQTEKWHYSLKAQNYDDN